MPNKKKQAARNGYYFYMLDVRDEIEGKEGYRPSMAELQTLASPGWAELSTEDKAYYNSKAKEEKAKGKDAGQKFNSLGISYATLDAQEQEKEEAEDAMKATIKAIVTFSSIEAVRKTLFYVSHVNFYYKIYQNQQDWYCPCEISVIEFSIEDGVTNKFHQILHQGNLPLGVRADAKEQAEKYHDIHLNAKPGKPAPRKEENLQLVFSRVIEFLRRGATRDSSGREILPPVFTMPDSGHLNHSITAVKNALEKFSEAAHERRELFRVYPIHMLFFYLKMKFDEGFKQEHGAAILQMELEKDLFAAAPNLECEYHMDGENRWCSQALALRWVYTILDHVTHKAGVEPVSGKHLPGGILTCSFQQVDPWTTQETSKPQNTDDEWTVVKVKDINARRNQDQMERVKSAQNIPPPRITRGWNSVASAGSSQPSDNDFPAMSGFPSLGEAGNHQSRFPSAGRGQSIGLKDQSMKKPFGRGKLFEK